MLHDFKILSVNYHRKVAALKNFEIVLKGEATHAVTELDNQKKTFDARLDGIYF